MIKADSAFLTVMRAESTTEAAGQQVQDLTQSVVPGAAEPEKFASPLMKSPPLLLESHSLLSAPFPTTDTFLP